MLRSESMDYYQLVLPRESAWEIINALGQIDSIHIIESKSLQKPFHQQVKRCEESLIKIANFERMLSDNDIHTHKIPRDSFEYTRLFQYWTQKSYESRKIAISMLDELDSEIEKQWEYYMDLNKRLESTTLQLVNSESKMSIFKASQVTLGNNFYESLSRKAEPLRSSSRSWEVGNVSYKCGIIRKEEESRFQRLVFRMSKGNAFTNFVPVESVYDSDQPEMKHKSVFFILFPSRDIMYLQGKLDKLIENYSQDMIDLPQSREALTRQIQQLTKAIEDYKAILKLTRDQRDNFLSKLVNIALPQHPFTKVQYLKIFMLKQRQIFYQLNQMQVFNNFIQGRIYIPAKQFDTVRKLLAKLQRKDSPSAQLIKHSSKTYPTMFITNDFTSSAQDIVDTYGVPRYKEANPGLFTCVTFPFLFGVMFGDIMHGGILLAFGLMLMWNREKYERTWMGMLTPHRYLITLMGFFSFYCGFVYNDYLSLNLDLFGSCYQPELAQPGGLIPRISNNCVYPFGVDPVWGVTSNGLTFLNSMKMKLSVIIGVIHMTAGVLLKASNAIYFKSKMDFVFEFIPQILFLLLLFGYMDFLIIYKWTVDWGLFPANAPSIITTMINLPLNLGRTQDCCGGQPMWGNYQTTSQNTIQLVFLIVSLLCIPLMLLPKPLYEIYCSGHRKKHSQKGESLLSEDNMALDLAKKSSSIMEGNQEEEAHGSDEIFVHQMIETIEYVLGCISNTASYLRLWALSLAHSQLAEVFFDKTVEHSIVSGYSGIPMMVIGFVILALATFGVLLCMDTMQCFLHALRLHWVEFQNKFYKADGFPFIPFSFKNVAIKAMSQP